MTTTETRSPAAESPQTPGRRRRAIGGVLIGVLAVVAVGVYLSVNNGSDDARVEPVETFEDVYARVADALVAYDPVAFADAPDARWGGIVQPDLMGWQITLLGLDPELDDCQGSTTIRCRLTYGNDYFYSVVLGHNVEGSVTVEMLGDNTFTITKWPFPNEVVYLESEFRGWIRASHPELETRMFGNDAYGVFRFSEDALQLHADYRDEFIAHRNAQTSGDDLGG